MFPFCLPVVYIAFLWIQLIGPSVPDFGTYRISEQRRLRRVCAYVQTRQSLRCLYTQSMDADES